MMTSIVDKVDFYSGLAPGNVFSWHTMNGGPAKFAWLVLDVCLPFASLKQYEIPKEYSTARLEEIKLFRTLRTPAPNPLANLNYVHHESFGSEFKLIDVLKVSIHLEEIHREPEEILWLVKNPLTVPSKKQQKTDTMESFLITRLENRIWNALGYVGINRYEARRKYHIGERDKSYLGSARIWNIENELCNWIRYVQHCDNGVHWARSDMTQHFPFWGAGTYTGLPIGFRLDTENMIGTCDINKVWKW